LVLFFKKERFLSFLSEFHGMQRRRFLAGGAAIILAGAGAPRVILRTAIGEIALALDLAAAPISAGAFLACVNRGFFDGGSFTRVVRPENDHGHPQISVVEGGPRPGASPPPIAHETTQKTGLRHLDGTVSLGRDAPGTATGGDFFICLGDQPGLDFGGTRNPDRQGFAAFGHVVSGMEVVRRIWGMESRGHSDDAYTVGQMLTSPVTFVARKDGLF